MLLQRVVRNLNLRNWSTALAEILIVVIGIFIGLQVDDWNQTRKDQIDEGSFLISLHDDLLRADELSQRLRRRRVDMLDHMLSTADVLFDRTKRNALTDEECNSIVWSTAFNITAPELPTVDELISTGRMGIIRNKGLATALVALRQARAALDRTISEKSASSNFISLPTIFPDLFQLTVQNDGPFGEVQTRNENCDLVAMRASLPFLNQFSLNVDGYDAYIRDGVKPWSLQFDRVHELVDSALAIDHNTKANK